jgi:ABC-type sugar transport system ATPase subunit
MDEPTAALSHSEVNKLFASIRQLCERGTAILYISHVLDEIFTIAQEVTVLRDGEVKLHTSTGNLTRAKLIDAMLGRELSLETKQMTPHDFNNRPVALECRHLSRRRVFEDIDLQVYEGEIVCITGLVGAKRTELVRAIYGAEPATGGEIYVDGKLVKIRHPVDAIRLGIGFVPEDRQQDGLFLDLSIMVNTVMASLQRLSRMGLLISHRLKSLTNAQIQKLELIPPLPDYPVKNLSGGNQQKVQLGRWLAGNTHILILDEPTLGVDVGTKARIYQLMRELAAARTTILIVSSDLEEVMAVADRIVVMANGRITGVFPRQTVSQQQILAAASGETA